MRLSVVLYLVSVVNCLLAISMAIPMAISVSTGEEDWPAFALAAGATLLLNLPVLLRTRQPVDLLRQREGLAVVTLSWLEACLFCALPFWFYGQSIGTTALQRFVNCFFEAASGLTTTGASILSTVETLPHGILWWRAVLQWYGGGGIILFTLALLPHLGVGGIHLYKAELPGPSADKMLPRIRESALVFWKVYALFTVAEAAALAAAGMSPFDAICHAFTTMATGGFSTKDAGIMAYADKPWVLVVLLVFMIMAGTSFSLHWLVIERRKPRLYLADVEFRAYLAVNLGVTFVVSGMLIAHGVVGASASVLLQTAFTVVSLTTTTGYASCDYEAWFSRVPSSAVLLFLCLFLGGMAGSTAGGIKTLRWWLLAKASWRELKRQLHPRGVFPIKLSNHPVGEAVVSESYAFASMYLATFLLGTLLVTLAGVDPTTAGSAVAACMGNVGPGMGAVGPTESYAGLPSVTKWLLSVLMVVGRLELFTVYALFVPMVRHV